MGSAVSDTTAAQSARKLLMLGRDYRVAKNSLTFVANAIY